MNTKLLLLAVVASPCLCLSQDLAMNNIPLTTAVTSHTDHQQICDMETRGYGLDNLLVKGTVVINSKGKDTNLNAVVFTTNQSTRIRINYAEIAQVIDYSVTGEKATIFLPRKDVVFTGSKVDVCKLKSWFSLLTSELCGYSLMFPNAWDANATQRRYIREKNTMVVINTTGDIVKVLKKVVFGRTTDGKIIITNIYKYDENGDLTGIISFDNYKTINGQLIPHQVSFSVTEDAKITFNFSEVLMDQQYNETIFNITIPPEAKTLDIQELEKKDWLS